jgi:hypothetical protein
MPLLYHLNGGFWHLDPVTGKETALCPTTSLDKLSQLPRHNRFASDPYPETWIVRSDADRLRGYRAAQIQHTA